MGRAIAMEIFGNHLGDFWSQTRRNHTASSCWRRGSYSIVSHPDQEDMDRHPSASSSWMSLEETPRYPRTSRCSCVFFTTTHSIIYKTLLFENRFTSWWGGYGSPSIRYVILDAAWGNFKISDNFSLFLLFFATTSSIIYTSIQLGYRFSFWKELASFHILIRRMRTAIPQHRHTG